ncbi:hypothetical protein [Geobacillus stearothermophilus]|uniref:hypothetical protein n=1 Tax=Geobacillus stearothermophilus TaxID=1422 RepID=UPI003D233A93
MFKYILVFVLFYTIRWLIPFLTFPNRRNILSIIDLPSLLIASIIGSVYFLGQRVLLLPLNFSYETLDTISYIFLFSTIFWVIGFGLTYFNEKNFITGMLIKQYKKIERNISFENLSKKMFFIFVIGVLCLTYSFYKMHLIPMFADDPFMAKFFAGPYQDVYRPIAHFYRVGLNLLPVFLLFSTFFLLSKKSLPERVKYLTFTGICIILLTLTLRRGLIAFNVITAIIFFVAVYMKKRYFYIFLFLYLLIFSFGSAVNQLILFLKGKVVSISFLSIIYGMPDISDLIVFMEKWLSSNADYTLGRTIFGGLIPFHYEWNPATYTKIIVSGDSNAATGGFRLPVEIWGFVSFGYIGALVFGFFHGCITAIVYKIQYCLLINTTKDNSKLEVFLKLLYIEFVYLLSNFLFNMTLDSLLLITIYIYIMYQQNNRKVKLKIPTVDEHFSLQ